MIRLLTLLLFCVSLIATGCTNAPFDWSQFDGVFSDSPLQQPPNQFPPQNVPPTVLPASPYAPSPCGPDGCPCPINGEETVESYGTEVSDHGSQVNREATEEVKGDCPTCPNRVTRPTVIAPRPIATRPPLQIVHPSHLPLPKLAPGEVFMGWGPLVTKPASITMPRPKPTPPAVAATCPDGKCEQVKQGIFACQHCGRSTVGAGWHELWADDGTPLTCLCESCWRSLSPNQRAAELRRYAKTQTIGALSPIVQDAIESASIDSTPTIPFQSYGTEF